MNDTKTNSETASTIEPKLEVLAIPVADVDRSKRFYERLGWRLDADFVNGDWRVVQLTPPGSPCSILFGRGITTAVPGSVQGLFLVVSDVVAARAELAARGVDISEVFHFDQGGLHVVGKTGRVSGPDPEGGSYRSFASFSDPDGNGWLLQEIKARLPGRGLTLDVANLSELLREAEQHHALYEATAPKHHWADWYGAYVVARERGGTPDEAANDAALRMKSSLR